MRLLSVSNVLASAMSTFVRFPFVVLSGAALSAAIIADLNTDREWMVAVLGISLMTALGLFAERYVRGNVARIAVSLAGLGLLLYYYLELPSHSKFDTEAMRFGLLLVASHLLVSFAGFSARGQVNGFWQFNRIILLRALTTTLFSGVLYGGLALALAAVDKLFDVDIHHQAYADLFGLIAGIFHPWFFVAGIPADLEALESDVEYPKVLRYFVQFVLLPLIGIYAVILYVYSAKIMVTWDWPRGWVSTLILGFAVGGILSFLLLHPLRDRADHPWIKRFSSLFFVLLAPLVVLLVLSIWRRVQEYGITEPRYFVIVTALWLACMVVYFLASKHRSIKVIPMSLAALALISAVGPWSAFEVSANDQIAQLRTFLTGRRILVAGKIVPPSKRLEGEDANRVSSILRYLERRDRLDDIAGWFTNATLPMSQYGALAMIEGEAHVYENATPYELRLVADSTDYIAVTGFDLYVQYGQQFGSFSRQSAYLDGVEYAIAVKADSLVLTVTRNGAEHARFNLTSVIAPPHFTMPPGEANGATDDYSMLPRSALMLDAERGGPARMQIRDIRFLRPSKSRPFSLQGIDAMILIKR